MDEELNSEVNYLVFEGDNLTCDHVDLAIQAEEPAHCVRTSRSTTTPMTKMATASSSSHTD